MKKILYQSHIPKGDVTNSGNYQQMVTGYISSTFNKAKGDTLKSKENSIKIRSIHSVPKSFFTCEMFYESRSIYASKSPSSYVKAEATHPHSADEYDMWEVKCPTPVKMFAKSSNIVKIQETMYLTDCSACYATGNLPCSCGNGTETCPDCNGYGAFNCNQCNGYGEHSCYSCNGVGYTTRMEIVGYENGNVPIWENVKYNCTSCYGSGRVRCNYCGGSGRITCNTCRGSGIITCRRCHGTMQVTCNVYNGLGHFLDCVQVSQNHDISSLTRVMEEISINKELYGKQHFATFAPHANDYLICEFVSDSPIPAIDTSEILSNSSNTNWDLQKEMDKFLSDIRRSNNTRRALQYRVRIYQRNVLEVIYDFDERPYHMLIDASTNEVLMDKNPYEHIAAAMLEDIKTYAKEGKYKSFLNEYDEFISITGFDNVAYSENDIKPIMKKVNHKFSLSFVIAAGIVQALIIMIAYDETAIFEPIALLVFVLPSLIAGFIISKYWKKLAVDNEMLMRALMFGLSAAAAFVIHSVAHMIFF